MPAELSILPRTCGACERELLPLRSSCMYCGWEPGDPDAAYGSSIQEGTFHEGASLWRFVFGAVVLGPIGVVLARTALSEEALVLLALAVPLLVIGPGAVLVQLVRRTRGAVEVTQAGIRRGGELLRWRDFESAEHFHGLSGDPRAAHGYGRAMTAIKMPLLLGPNPIKIVLGFFFFPFLFLLFVVLPAIGVVTPWHSRVVLERRRGDRLTFHDLDDPSGFADAAVARLWGLGKR